MKIEHDKPESKIYDLYVNGKQQTNWVSADEGEGEYELFVEDVPWRGGGRIVDTDNPTGYQTLRQKGKVEFKRNDLPDPTVPSVLDSRKDWEGWGNYCGAVDTSSIGVSLQRKDLEDLRDRLFPIGYRPPTDPMEVVDYQPAPRSSSMRDLLLSAGYDMGGSLEFPTLGAIRAITPDEEIWDRAWECYAAECVKAGFSCSMSCLEFYGFLAETINARERAVPLSEDQQMALVYLNEAADHKPFTVSEVIRIGEPVPDSTLEEFDELVRDKPRGQRVEIGFTKEEIEEWGRTGVEPPHLTQRIREALLRGVRHAERGSREC